MRRFQVGLSLLMTDGVLGGTSTLRSRRLDPVQWGGTRGMEGVETSLWRECLMNPDCPELTPDISDPVFELEWGERQISDKWYPESKVQRVPDVAGDHRVSGKRVHRRLLPSTIPEISYRCDPRRLEK